MKSLDFVVIGAQKAGTTSLFQYLRRHDELFIPDRKELHFFDRNDNYRMGWSAFAESFYGPDVEDLLWGDVTPRYMGDVRVPERLAATMPDVQIIAILRDPIDRAYSHYCMAVRRGTETRSFQQAAQDAQKVDRAEALSPPIDETDCYLYWGEYGRILRNYLCFFNRNQIKVLFLSDLSSRPEQTLNEVLGFLGVDRSFQPENTSRNYNSRAVSSLRQKFRPLRLLPLVRGAVDAIPSHWKENLYGTLSSLYDELIGIVHANRNRPSFDEEILIRYFKKDIKKLTYLLSVEVPWSRFLKSPGGPGPSSASRTE